MEHSLLFSIHRNDDSCFRYHIKLNSKGIMSVLITIVDDEPDIVELVSMHLKKAGFYVKGFYEVTEFFKFLEKEVPDLIILDLMLPDSDGFDVCKQLKMNAKLSSVPIIMLTARGEEFDRVLGLELGADDYVTKPFSVRELVARVKAVLRRKDHNIPTKKVRIRNLLEIDFDKYEVRVEDKKLNLTPTEFRILELISSSKGAVFSREKILEHLWGNEKIVIDRTVDVHIRHLREKLGVAGKFIKNVRGIGYKIEE